MLSYAENSDGTRLKFYCFKNLYRNGIENNVMSLKYEKKIFKNFFKFESKKKKINQGLKKKKKNCKL